MDNDGLGQLSTWTGNDLGVKCLIHSESFTKHHRTWDYAETWAWDNSETWMWDLNNLGTL